MRKKLKERFKKFIIQCIPLSYKEDIYYSLELDRDRIFRQVNILLKENGLKYSFTRSKDLSMWFEIKDTHESIIATMTGALVSSLLTNPTAFKRYIESEIIKDYNVIRPNINNKLDK